MVDIPRFQPQATPVSTAALPGPVMEAPQPVRAPRGPAPSAPVMPPPPKQFDNGFLQSLNNFGSSLGRAGSMFKEQYELDVKKAEDKAMLEAASLPSDKLLTRMEEQTLEDTSKANIDGAMRGYGRILASRLPNEVLAAQAAGVLSEEQIPDFIRSKTKLYADKFQSDEFNKSFGPTAADVVSRYEAEALKKSADAAKQLHINTMVAEAFENRPKILGGSEEEQIAAIHKYLDGTLEKAAGDKLISKQDVDKTMLDMAVKAANMGDVTLTRAILTKKRGSNPSLMEFDERAQTILSTAESQYQKLNRFKTEETVFDLKQLALKGALGTSPVWKAISNNHEAAYRLGISGEQLGSLQAANETANRALAYEKNPEFVQGIAKAIHEGRPQDLPSINDVRVRNIWSPAEYQNMQQQATNSMFSKRESMTAAANQNIYEAGVAKFATDLRLSSPAAWTTLQDQKVLMPNGTTRPVSADDLRVEAMKQQLDTIDKQYGSDPMKANAMKVDFMVERAFIAPDMAAAIRKGALVTPLSGATAQTPEGKKQAYEAQLVGLGLYRQFANRQARPLLEDEKGAGRDATRFYFMADVLSQVKYGGDDLAALQELAMGAQRDNEAVSAELVKVSKASTMSYLQPALTEIQDTPGWGSTPLKNPNFVISSSKQLAEVFVRMGTDAETAYKAAGAYLAKTYISYEGIAVPRGGDQTYREVQDFVMKKIEEQHPKELEAVGDLVLAPVVAASQFGASGLHSLFSKDNGMTAIPIGTVSIKQRDGSTLTFNPNSMPVEIVRKIKDAMMFEVEQKAIVNRSPSMMERDSKLPRATDPVPFAISQ